jgi:16S rRNA (adenine1518-N6/adenine1519-N6)-dimethyltransferase
MYTLKKHFGQHFLHDENICKKIVATLDPLQDAHLLEVGPGGGALSKYLIDLHNIHYKAIEIDEEKVQYLQATYPAIKDSLIHEDFLKSRPPFDEHFSIIGNFPYNISTQIMFKVLDWESQVDMVVGMFQKEVAQRIAAKHDNKVYGILSVLLQSFFHIEYLFDVNENCFTPPPKVKSGVIRLTNSHNPYNITNKNSYMKIVKAAFGQRRKTLRNALKPLLPENVVNDPVFDKRAEQLSVADFADLFLKYFAK